MAAFPTSRHPGSPPPQGLSGLGIHPHGRQGEGSSGASLVSATAVGAVAAPWQLGFFAAALAVIVLAFTLSGCCHRRRSDSPAGRACMWCIWRWPYVSPAGDLAAVRRRTRAARNPSFGCWRWSGPRTSAPMSADASSAAPSWRRPSAPKRPGRGPLAAFGLRCACGQRRGCIGAITTRSAPAAGLDAILLSIISQIGDLFESALKRRYQVKDSGSLIPGHGGAMDRFDGLWAAAPLTALFCAILGGGVQHW